MNYVNGLFNFIKTSPTAFHAVDTVAKTLEENGYKELFECYEWDLKSGKYFVRRNGSSLMAFRIGEEATGFNIISAHSDSPSFRVKMTAEEKSAYTRLEVEKYGGMIYYTWLDRPLSVAGRVIVDTDKGIETRLVNLEKNTVSIPSVAIHMNRGVNDGYKFNPAHDMLPLYTMDEEVGGFMEEIAQSANTTPDKILSHDLFLYNRDEGLTFGKNGEFILCPRLDDLESVYSAMEAFLESKDTTTVPVLAVFDNEEVGSATKQGAGSTFLRDTLQRIAENDEQYRILLENSFMLSADNAHAKHPNHPELADPDNAPLMNHGLVIKYNANQKYATDGLSDAIFRKICKRVSVPVQNYYNRADMPGGSTLGSISDTCVSIPTVDIGYAQLAMHSANETAGAKDLDGMISAMREFYSTPLKKKSGNVKF